MKKTIVAAALIAGVSGPFAVNAATDQTSEATFAGPVAWMAVGDVIAKLESQGYEVLKIEREDGRFFEVEMRDANGIEVEAYLDAETAKPVTYDDGRDDDGEQFETDDD